MNCVEIAARSRVVQKKGGIDRIRRMDEIGRLKAAVEIADELGRETAKRKCAMRLAERLMVLGKYGRAKRICDRHMDELGFLKTASNANEALIRQGKFIESAKLNRKYSFTHGMATSAGLEIRRRIGNISYRGLKRLARKYRAERELARCIRDEADRFVSRGLRGEADWLRRKFLAEP